MTKINTPKAKEFTARGIKGLGRNTIINFLNENSKQLSQQLTDLDVERTLTLAQIPESIRNNRNIDIMCD